MLIVFCLVIVAVAFLRAIPAPPAKVECRDAIRARMGHADYRACGE